MQEGQPRPISRIERKDEDPFLTLIQEAKTFQQLLWAAERKRNGEESTTLEKELMTLEAEEEINEFIELEEIPKVPGLLEKVKEFLARRQEMNTEYYQATQVPFTKESEETFALHVINLESKPGAELSPHPIGIAPGFTVGEDGVRRNAEGLSELGYSSFTFVKPPEASAFDSTLAFPKGTSDFTKSHATALVRSMDALNEKKFSTPRTFNMIGYSFGAITTIAAAIAAPEKFHNIVLINPGGLTDIKDPYLLRFAKLVWRSPKHGKQVLREVGEKPTLSEKFEQLLDTGSTPDLNFANKKSILHSEFATEMGELGKRGGLPMAIQTASAISETNLVPLIRELEAKGIKITIIASEDDKLFPLNTVLESGKEAGVPAYDIAKGHANLGFDPGIISELCIDSFRELDPVGEKVQPESVSDTDIRLDRAA